MPSGTCSPAGSWATAVIYSALPARPRGSCWLTLVPQPVQANSKAQGWLRPRAEKAMAFPLGPAVIICLPSIVNPDAGGGGAQQCGCISTPTGLQSLTNTLSFPCERCLLLTRAHHSVVRLLCADSFPRSFPFNIHHQWNLYLMFSLHPLTLCGANDKLNLPCPKWLFMIWYSIDW